MLIHINVYYFLRMNLIKIIVIIFIIYFIRRFIQMYKVLQSIKMKQQEEAKKNSTVNKEAIETEYKIL